MLIALTGKMGSGKSTFVEVLRKMQKEAFVLAKFAAPLYSMQTEIYRIAGLRLEEGQKDRELLQFLGTEWGRKKDPNFWVKIWAKDAAAMLKASYDVVSDDCRFDNEAEIVREMGGVVVRIITDEDKRKARMVEGNFANTGHASEAGINDAYVDYTINNNGTQAEFEASITALVKSLIEKETASKSKSAVCLIGDQRAQRS